MKPLVCFRLPPVPVAGELTVLPVAADIGRSLCRFANSRKNGGGGSESHPGSHDSWPHFEVRQLVAHSPGLLVWLLAQEGDNRQLDDEHWIGRQFLTLFSSSAPVTASQPAIRLAWRAQRRFFKALSKVDSRAEQSPTPTTVAAVRKRLTHLVSRFSGSTRHVAGEWLASRMPNDSQLQMLSRQLAAETVVQPLTASNLPDGGNSLAESHDFRRRLREEKLASLKRLAYGASHEINNPLANIASRAQTLLRDEADHDRRRKLASINQQAFRAHEMIADLMLFANPPAPQFTATDVGQLVTRVVQEMQAAAQQQQTMLEFHHHVPAEASLDGTQLAEAVKALVQNALEALESGGTIVVSLNATDTDWIEITVQDDGPGFDSGQIEFVFDPFHSGREAGRGLGFGLSKAWRIAELHGGSIVAENLSDGGARISMRLPANPPAAPN